MYSKITNISDTTSILLKVEKETKIISFFLSVDTPIIIPGKVIPGKGRGKKLGFPTANLEVVPAPDLSLEGIYAAYTHVNGKRYPSVVFIGAAETFQESDWSYETYLLDFDQDLYDQELQLELLQKIRANQKFSGEKELIQAIETDVTTARQFFGL